MRKFKIGIDIDGTLTEPDFWVDIMNEYFHKELDYKTNQIYDWLEAYEIDEDEFSVFYRNEGPEMHYQAKIRDNAQEVISFFNNHHEICYLTARQKWLSEVTAKWLDKYQLPGEHFILGTHNKLPYAKELGCDLFIEDNYNVANELAEGGIKVLLLNCSYNIHKKIDRSIVRVNNWLDIKKAIMDFSQRGF